MTDHIADVSKMVGHTPTLEWSEKMGMWRLQTYSQINGSVSHIFFCRNKGEGEELLRAVNSHEALLEAARYFRSLVDADLLDGLTRNGNPYNDAIARAEGRP